MYIIKCVHRLYIIHVASHFIQKYHTHTQGAGRCIIILSLTGRVIVILTNVRTLVNTLKTRIYDCINTIAGRVGISRTTLWNVRAPVRRVSVTHTHTPESFTVTWPAITHHWRSLARSWTIKTSVNSSRDGPTNDASRLHTNNTSIHCCIILTTII